MLRGRGIAGGRWLVSGELAELVRLVLVLACSCGLSLYAIRRFMASRDGSGEMAPRIAVLERENAQLREEVSMLKTAFRAVQEENKDLRCEVEKLQNQVAALNDQLHSSRNQADDWRAVALRQKPE